ncbi:hypothetical protein BRADI_2g21876v3 [Brachypodium distachyon]|uniref:Uncharacterized protein n=1 Tax=Brachypodium distachyon TaxID=15368 RepID=A0A2K2D9S2_BRADI|nr:hypothetical protein BRADI_2g21876v3 [Brachypodium distachyon]
MAWYQCASMKQNQSHVFIIIDVLHKRSGLFYKNCNLLSNRYLHWIDHQSTWDFFSYPLSTSAQLYV